VTQASYDAQHETEVARHTVQHDNCVIPSHARVVMLNGNGAHRRNCSVAPGARQGQQMTLVGYTWSVQLAEPHPLIRARQCRIAPTFGNTPSSGPDTMLRTLELVRHMASNVLNEGRHFP